MKATIGVYVDKGASVGTVLRAIASEVETSYIVRTVTAEHLDSSSFFEDLSVFVMPGGADLPYCAKLNGARNGRLREWVADGGTYLGLCAGAYYGSRRIDFHGLGWEVAGQRELDFVPATAIGSLTELAPLYDFTLKSAAVASLLREDGEASAAFYHGGCFFAVDDGAEANVLASYEHVKGNPPAIVESVAGRGKAILCGVHPEVSFKELGIQIRGIGNSAGGGSYDRLLLDLKEVEDKRRMLWRNLLESCGLKLRLG